MHWWSLRTEVSDSFLIYLVFPPLLHLVESCGLFSEVSLSCLTLCPGGPPKASGAHPRAKGTLDVHVTCAA